MPLPNNNVRLAGLMNVGAGEVHANIDRAGAYSGTPNSSATQQTLGCNHNLSKRTQVYAFVTRVNDDAAALDGSDFSSFAVACATTSDGGGGKVVGEPPSTRRSPGRSD